MNNHFDIYFKGEIIDGHDPETVRQAVGALFHLADAKLDKLFSGRPVKIKTGLDIEKAGKFRAAFTKAGAIVHIVPTGQGFKEKAKSASSAGNRTVKRMRAWKLMPPGLLLPPRKPPEPPNVDIDHLSVAPPASGSLEEFTQYRTPVEIPDISALEIVENPDEPLDNRPRPVTEIPDISHLEVAPPRSGSLEEFAQHKPPVPIPDISRLSLDIPASE